jgi:hypothetical protein
MTKNKIKVTSNTKNTLSNEETVFFSDNKLFQNIIWNFELVDCLNSTKLNIVKTSTDHWSSL